MKNNSFKQNLYESVKTIVESDADHFLLRQHKLFTLVSIGLQYMLFRSNKEPGAYIIRIKNGIFAEKLAQKAKDDITAKFLRSIMIPRKMKYGKSIFYLDFFQFNTWNLTNEIPHQKIKGALIINDSRDRPMEDEELAEAGLDIGLPSDYYLTSLQSIAPKTITIDYNYKNDELENIAFPFIGEEKGKLHSDVTLSNEVLNLDFSDEE